jgi:hypothetical protein
MDRKTYCMVALIIFTCAEEACDNLLGAWA